MVAEGRTTPGGGRARTRSFRQSLLVAYAGRIGERLRSAAVDAASAVDDDRLLPVLARRADAVDEVFGEGLTSRSVTVADAAGYVAGRAAADAASLTLERDRIER